MAYADKRDGKHTGSFVGEWPIGRKKRRFKTMQAAKDYETFTKLMGREPPTIDDGLQSTGAPTFAEVAQLCKADGGPKGKWKKERDCSIIQRVDYCVSIIGTYEIQQVTRTVLKKITESLQGRAKAPGKQQTITNATINRYLNAAGAVLTWAYRNDMIPTRPEAPLLPEDERKERDVLPFGQDEVVLRLMREAGHGIEALCVEVLAETGLREGELLKLSPDQVAIGHVENEDGTNDPIGVITLRKEQVKNNRSRMVTIRADLAKEIKAVIATQSLPNKDRLLRTFKSAVKGAGITGNVVIHSLRHTRNTRLQKAGVEQKIRMDMLGHTSEVVNNMYTHLDLADQLEAEKKLREYAGKQAKRNVVIPATFRKSS
jgi:integrase